METMEKKTEMHFIHILLSTSNGFELVSLSYNFLINVVHRSSSFPTVHAIA